MCTTALEGQIESHSLKLPHLRSLESSWCLVLKKSGNARAVLKCTSTIFLLKKRRGEEIGETKYGTSYVARLLSTSSFHTWIDRGDDEKQTPVSLAKLLALS